MRQFSLLALLAGLIHQRQGALHPSLAATVRPMAVCINTSRFPLVLVRMQLWDMRSMQRAGGVPKASAQPLRDVDWAAQTPHVLSTVGDDRRLRVWDLRWALFPRAVGIGNR